MHVEAKKIKTALRDVIDFELGLDVVSMGLIRDIDVQEKATIITMILTSPMCPMASTMMQRVKDRANEVSDKPVGVVLGQERWKPEFMSEDARDTLGI